MIKIICIGKLKENYLKDAEQEYLKRLKKYTHGIIIVFLLQKTEKQCDSKIYHIFMRDFMLFCHQTKTTT